MVVESTLHIQAAQDESGGEKAKSIESQQWSTRGYILDILLNTMYHRKWFTSPRVYRWYFKKTEYGKTQQRLFQELLQNGFKRELFQIVFPGQTAGLVKTLDDTIWFDEAHIRFYDDGGIDIELEQGRFWRDHWKWDRRFAGEYLQEFLEKLNLSDGDRHFIVNHLLQSKEMHKLCERWEHNEYFQKRIAITTFVTIMFLWEYVLGTGLAALLIYMISKPQ